MNNWKPTFVPSCILEMDQRREAILELKSTMEDSFSSSPEISYI